MLQTHQKMDSNISNRKSYIKISIDKTCGDVTNLQIIFGVMFTIILMRPLQYRLSVRFCFRSLTFTYLSQVCLRRELVDLAHCLGSGRSRRLRLLLLRGPLTRELRRVEHYGGPRREILAHHV